MQGDKSEAVIRVVLVRDGTDEGIALPGQDALVMERDSGIVNTV